MNTRRVSANDVTLAVYEWGDPDSPTVVLIHGYPDTAAVWDLVADRLQGRYHVVAYDVRGAGASTPGRDGYQLDRLLADLVAVIDATSGGRPVHLVGHDWGSIQGWEAATSEDIAGRVASFTSMSGPSLDHVGWWVRRRRRPSPRALRQLAGQTSRSWYMYLFHLPVLPELVWRAGARVWPAALRRIEGIPPAEGHPAPTLADDAVRGLELYRDNIRQRTLHPRKAYARVPVQLIVATRDRYASPALFEDLDEWVPDLWRRSIPAGHWGTLRRHPDVIARWIGEFVDHVEGGDETRGLRRARSGVARGDFDGHLVLVTGAGSGIGAATADAFAKQGAEVVAVDIDGEAAARTAERVGGHAYQVDVSDAAAMERLAKDVERDHGVPDIVVNNAGIGVAGSFLDTDLADWERVIDVNLWGVIHGSRLFARQLVERGEGGHIVNIASAAAYLPSRALPAYATTKAAVLMLTECLRAELTGRGIGVTAICPGFVNTNITRTTRFAGLSDAEQERERERAARRYQRRNYAPERVAAQILRAVRRDRAVVPVTVEARVGYALSRLSPGTLRALARVAR